MSNFRPGYLEQGSPLGMTVQDTILIADGQRVDCSGVSLLKLRSNSTTASQRTFILNASSLVGHELVIVFVSGASTTCELANSGTVRLSAAWTPTQYDALTLVSDGTAWQEVGRSMLATLPNVALADGEILVGNASNLAAAVAVSGDIAIDNAGVTTIQAGAVELGMLDAGIAPAFVAVYGDDAVTTAGGAAAEAITVTGALSTDIAVVTLINDGTNNVTYKSAALSADTLTVTFSGDPGNDAVISYVIFRAAT